MTCPWSPSELVTDIGLNQRSPWLPASILVLKASYALPWLEWLLEKGKLGGGSAPPESGKADLFCHFPAGSLQAARAHLCTGEPCVGWSWSEGRKGPAVAEGQHGQIQFEAERRAPSTAEPRIPRWKYLSVQLLPEIQDFVDTTDFRGSLGI